MSADMAILSDSAKARFRAMLAKNRPHAFALYLPVTNTAQGRETITGYTLVTTGACRLSQMPSDDKERLVGAAAVATRRYLFFCDVAVPVLQEHVIRVTGTTPDDGEEGGEDWTTYLQVDAIDTPRRASLVELKVATTEVEKPVLLV